MGARQAMTYLQRDLAFFLRHWPLIRALFWSLAVLLGAEAVIML